MKAKPLKEIYGVGYQDCPIEEATHVQLALPGPLMTRIIPVMLKGQRRGTNCWSWNGDTEKPTLKPSIRTVCRTILCHTFVNDGMVQFLDDCSHELAGKTLELLEVV